jgi:hypothetical protein
MDSFWLVAYLVLSGAALLLSVLLAVQTWEHRRYSRSCMRGRDRHWPAGRAAVIAPCKGVDVGMEKNLAALFRQDYDDFEIAFVVENPDDPACAVIDRLIADHPCVAARLIVAGRSSRSGQKVHNLRAAVAALGPDVQYLAFVDSDAAPRSEWLRLLLARLDRPEIGATTGYRWFIPARPSLANYLLYSMNCGVMMLLGLRGQHWVWGGSWAIRRERFEALGLHDAWKGTVSDDLMASRLLGEARLPTRFEPVGVVGSPLDQSFGQMFAFLRRQYLLGRHHVGFWWAAALAGCTVTSLAWLASAAAIGWSLLGGGLPLWIPLCTAAVLYAVGVFRGMVRQSLVKTYFPGQERVLRGAKRFDIWAGPLAALVNWLGMLSSTVGRHIRWRGVVYRMLHGGRIRLVRRDAPSGDANREDRDHEPPAIISLEEYAQARVKTG